MNAACGGFVHDVMATKKKRESTGRWGVHIPFTGEVYVEVDAATKDEAIEKAWDVVNERAKDADGFPFDFDLAVVEMQYHDHVVQGNVSSAVLNHVVAEPIKGTKPVKSE